MLPPECLEVIFAFLHDDVQSLYACLLVNWFWCSTAVSRLWSQPFRIVPKYRARYLIDAYLTCLSEEDLDQVVLRKNYIKMPGNNPTFDYPKFLRTLDYYD